MKTPFDELTIHEMAQRASVLAANYPRFATPG